MTVAGFVLAGGHSRRMGRDKALLPWDGTTLLDHAVARVRAATAAPPTVLSGRELRYQDRGLRALADEEPGRGALGGVLTGLARMTADAGLFLAVDLPIVPEALLRHLVARAEGADAVVAFSPAGAEPLCAVYAKSCEPAIRACMASGELEMTSFWRHVAVRALYPEAIARFGDPERLFRNLNAAADYERAREEAT
jgi:molybdopterin-guanine dinucleotide biosynthesis protein A